MNVPPDQQLATVATKDEQRREEVVYASSLGDATRGSGDARIAETEQVDDGTNKKKTWKKPVGMPKRPLSAYNLYFQHERRKLLGDEDAKKFEITDQAKRKHRKTHGKIGFAEMARKIGQKWKILPKEDKKEFQDEARMRKEAYLKEMEVYKKNLKDVKKKQSGEPVNSGYRAPSPRSDSAAVLATLSHHLSPPSHPGASPQLMYSPGMGLVQQPQQQQQQRVGQVFNPGGPGIEATRNALSNLFAAPQAFEYVPAGQHPQGIQVPAQNIQMPAQTIQYVPQNMILPSQNNAMLSSLQGQQQQHQIIVQQAQPQILLQPQVIQQQQLQPQQQQQQQQQLHQQQMLQQLQQQQQQGLFQQQQQQGMGMFQQAAPVGFLNIQQQQQQAQPPPQPARNQQPQQQP